MRNILLALIFVGCSASNKESAADKSVPQQPKADSVAVSKVTAPPPPPASVKANMTMMGAEVTSIQLNGDTDYIMGLALRTALPYRNTDVSFAEPGQELIVRPAFERDPGGGIIPTSPRNTRLLEARSLKVGDPIIGKISLFQDGLWYLVDTTLD